MILYVLRHAEAEPFALSDSTRRLTGRGEAQAEKVGHFCLRREIIPEVILTSPFARAEATARIVAEQLGQEVLTAPFLASGMTAYSALEEMKAYQQFRSLMIVGHQPDLGELIALLIGIVSPSAFPVRKASLTALDVYSFSPEGATLDFALPVHLL